MKKLFSKRKQPRADEGPPPPTTGGGAVPPLPLGGMTPGSGQYPGPASGPRNGGRPTTPAYSSSGYLQPLSPTSSGVSSAGRPISRTQSGMSSGRRSARRPREFIDLSQPEQVDAGGWEQQGEEGYGSGGSAVDEAEQIERDLALAYQLAVEDQQAAAAQAAQRQQPPLALQQPQQKQRGEVVAAAPPARPPSQPPSLQRSATLPPLGSLPSRSSHSFGQGLSQGHSQGLSAASEDVALAAALAESQFAAQQAAAQMELARESDAQYQAAVEAAMEDSLVTINYDGLLRDIQLWIFDLEGATGDVAAALDEASRMRGDLEAQMAAADPDDPAGMHRLLWLSEQYPLVEERLKEVAGRVAPVSDTVRSLKDLHEFIRNDQPPLSDAESVRDAVIARLFEDLGRQGLDTRHPFAGGAADAETPKKRGGLRSLLSLKRSDKPASSRGGDLRDLVRQLIEEAKDIPEPPPLPVDYSSLLADLRAWVPELQAVKNDVQAAAEGLHHQQEELEGEAAETPRDNREAWHRLGWYSEQYPLARGRLRGLEERLAPPTQAAAKSLLELIEYIEDQKPPLEEAAAKRDAALAQLLHQLAFQSLPNGPTPAAVRRAALDLVEEAAAVPPVPPFVDYDPLLADIQQWVEDLEGAGEDVAAEQRVAAAATTATAAQLAAADRAADPEGHYRLSWLSQQRPLVEERVQGVAGRLAPAQTAVQALEEARHQILISKPPLSEAEGIRDGAIAALMAALRQNGVGAQAVSPRRHSSGAAAADGEMTFRELAGTLLAEAQRLPAMPPMPIDYSSLLAGVRQWVAELDGAQSDVASAQQASAASASDGAAQLAAADEGADAEGWHRLQWLIQEQPLVAQRVQAVAAKLAPPAGTAIQALQQLVQQIDSAKPPLAEAEAARDAAIGALVASLAVNSPLAQGLELPPSPLGSDVRGAVRRQIEEAQRLPSMPPFVDYRPLLAELQRWQEELEGAQSDLAAVQQAASEASARSAAQLAAADEGADPEGWHRLNWLSQQHPAVAERLQQLGGRIAPAAAAASRALEEVEQLVRSKPPLAEAEAARDAALAPLGATLALDGPPAHGDVRGTVQQLVEQALEMPAMPPFVDYRPLLSELQQWQAELAGVQGDVAAAQAAAAAGSAESAAQLASADEGANPEGWHLLNWLSQQRPLVEQRLRGVEEQVSPATSAALQSLQDLVQLVKAKPALSDAEAARDAALGSLAAALAHEGAPALGSVRGAVQRQLEDAQRLPDMPGFVDYQPLLGRLHEWIADLEAAQAAVAAAQPAAAAEIAEGAAQLAAADEGADPEGWHRLQWLSQQRPLVQERLRGVEERVSPAIAAALQSLHELVQLVDTKPPLAEVEAASNVALGSLAASLAMAGLPARGSVHVVVQQQIEEARRLPSMPPFVDYRPLLGKLQQWIAELQAAQDSVAAAQQAAAAESSESAARLAAADEAADPEGWHRLNWLSQQRPLVEERLRGVEVQVSPATSAALQTLQDLVQLVETKPPLAEAEAAHQAAIASLAEALALEGVPDVRGAVARLVQEAQRLPPMPPFVDYRPLLGKLQRWQGELAGARGDVAAAQQAAGEARAEDERQLAAADAAAHPEGHYRLSWLSQQHPVVEARLQEVGGRVGAAADAAAQELQEVALLIKSKPPLAEAEAARDAALAGLVASLAVASLPAAPTTADVRGAVQQLLEEARRLPAMPPMPVNYEELLADVEKWLAELAGTRADVAAAQAAAAASAADGAAQLAAADEGADPEGWHRLNWLSQQQPLVEERLQGLGGRLEPTSAASQALRQLVQHINADKPKLADATVQRDAAVAALLEALGVQGVSVQSAADLRSTVARLIGEAQRLPSMPPFVDYRPLLAELQWWQEELAGARGDVAAAQQAAGDAAAANEAQLSAADKEADPEEWHRLNWLSHQLPDVESRLRDVARRVAPTSDALAALEKLRQHVEADKPPLAEAERKRDAAVAVLVAAPALSKLPANPSASDVRAAVGKLVKKAQHLPPVPPMPVPVYMPPPAPEGPHRSPLQAPKFYPPNLSVARPRRKSRGVKPAPEDAIRRDPRAITLYNELSKGRGVVVTTIDWESLSKQQAAGGTPAGSATPPVQRASTPGTPAAGRRATTPTPSPSAATKSASPAGSGAGPRTPRTPSPEVALLAPEPEMSEEAAAYLPTLAARGAAVASFALRSMQEVSDFVSDVKAQGGDAPRSGHAAATFPARRWTVMAEAAAVFDALLDACDALHKWECPPQANVVMEAHRLAAYMDRIAAVVVRVNYAHDPLRQRMAKAGLPWDDALLTDLRWAAQHAAAALMQQAMDSVDNKAKAKGSWQIGAVVKPLGSAFIGAFKVHQFCGGFNLRCAALFDTLHERTLHYSRMMDPAWFRSSKVAT